MLRLLVLALLAANLLFWAFTQGHLGVLGLQPNGVREPERLNRQVAPDKLVVRSASQPTGTPNRSDEPANAPEASASAAPETTPPEPPKLTTAAVAAQPTACWQATGLNANQTLLVRGALQNEADLPPDWTLTESVLPARWIVYLGKFSSAEALQRRRAELREAKIDHREVYAPALQPGLALGTYSTEEAARRALAEATLKGMTSAKAVQERQETRQYTLRLPALTEAQRRRITSLGVLADRPLQRCS